LKFRQIFDQLLPEVRSQTNARKVLKVVDDVKRIKEKARYVLTLNADGKVIGFLYKAEKGSFANVVAVLAPANLYGVYLTEALVLEIGISRTRPYQKSELASYGKKVTPYLRTRERVRSITTHELAQLWPTLEKVFSSATYQTRKRWKQKEGWWVRSKKGLWQFERGVYFSFDNRDSVARLFALNEEARRRQRFLRQYAGRIAGWLRPYGRRSYTDNRVKKFRGVREAVASWKGASLSPQDQEIVFGFLPSQAQYVFGLGLTANRLPSVERIRRKKEPHSYALQDGQLRLVRRKGSVHGKHCATFEFTFHQAVREASGL
jgi:hypothetical protein